MITKKKCNMIVIEGTTRLHCKTHHTEGFSYMDVKKRCMSVEDRGVFIRIKEMFKPKDKTRGGIE